jgi:hypothetical protein
MGGNNSMGGIGGNNGMSGIGGNNGMGGYEKKTQQDILMSKLGDKLLFDDNDSIKNRLDGLEVKTQRLEDDLKKVFLLVKKIHEKVFTAR